MPSGRSAELTYAALMERRSWAPLPAVVVLHGDAGFFKREIEKRFTRELFGDSPHPAVRRIKAGEKEGETLRLAEVLDELRTPSFFSSHRLVILEGAEAFLAAHRETLEPFAASGFTGGHLILNLDSLDLRTRFAKIVAEEGWAVSCQKPFDRPPPWQPEASPWDSELCRWVAARAREKGMSMDLELAHAFTQRVGTDLATLDEELEKLCTYLGPTGKQADLQAVEAVAGELRRDSIFDLVDAFLAADRAAALQIAERLFRIGYHPARGAAVLEPAGIWSMFVGAVVARLRALRRAHALAEKGPEAWVGLRLTPRAFLPRFQRDLVAARPDRIKRAFRALRELDRAVKTGARAQPLLEAFILKH